jgi:hypothetical protein
VSRKFHLCPSQIVKLREKKEKKKKISDTHWNFNHDTTSTTGKISTRLVQQHKIGSPTMILVGHISSLKTSATRYLWITRVTHSINCLWSLLVSLDRSFNVTFEFFLFFLNPLFSSLLLEIHACFSKFANQPLKCFSLDLAPLFLFQFVSF